MSRPIPPSYKTKNWPAYNEALRQRGSLTIWFDPDMVWVTAPTRTGFGSLVSGSLLEKGLSGRVEADYAEDGLRWTLRCPLSRATQAPPHTDAAGPTPAGDAAPGGVLIVGDGASMALSVANVVQGAGFHVIGPASDADGALALIGATRPFLGILDVHVGETTAERVATELSRIGVPLVCVSEQASERVPGAFDGAIFLPKPLDEASLLKAIRTHANLPSTQETEPGAKREA